MRESIKKFFSKISGPDLLIIFGLGLLGYGVGMFSWPIAAIIVGGLMLAGGVLGSIRGGGQATRPPENGGD